MFYVILNCSCHSSFLCVCASHPSCLFKQFSLIFRHTNVASRHDYYVMKICYSKVIYDFWVFMVNVKTKENFKCTWMLFSIFNELQHSLDVTKVATLLTHCSIINFLCTMKKENFMKIFNNFFFIFFFFIGQDLGEFENNLTFL